MNKYSNIGIGIALGTGKGFISTCRGTVKTMWGIGDAIVHKNTDKAVKIGKDKIKGVGKGFVNICKETYGLAIASYQNYSEGKEIIDENVSKKIICVGSVIGTAAVAGEFLPHFMPVDDSHGIAEAVGILPVLNIDDLDGVSNGMLVDNSDLDDIIAAGELDDTNHLSGTEYTRSAGAKEAFLYQHGYDSIPEGYEIHHIVPLCQGGSDSPDNMILLSEADHIKVTTAHSRFYDWHGIT